MLQKICISFYFKDIKLVQLSQVPRCFRVITDLTLENSPQVQPPQVWQNKEKKQTALAGNAEWIRTLCFFLTVFNLFNLFIQKLKHVLAKVDKSHFAVSSKSRLKF